MGSSHGIGLRSIFVFEDSGSFSALESQGAHAVTTLSRRSFLRGGLAAGGLAALSPVGPLQVLGLSMASGDELASSDGYGPLVLKAATNDPDTILMLPAAFNFQVLSRQGTKMSDGNPTPGIFDGMAAYPFGRSTGSDDDDDGEGHRLILIRNHENRERPGETKVVTGGAFEYDTSAFGGNTKLIVRRENAGRDADGNRLFTYTVERDFAILGGTSTNCAGGIVDKLWVASEEVVKRTNGKKHGYNFPIDAYAPGPVKATPILSQGRMSHEAVAWDGRFLYQTEDRSLSADPKLGTVGSVFYRWAPTNGEKPSRWNSATPGKLEGLKLRDEFHANMDTGRLVGASLPVEWVPVEQPDHEDDTDNRRDRVQGFTPTRIQAQDNGAAFFDRLEGAWFADGRVYFDATAGGPQNLGQLWEYDPRKSLLTLIYESNNAAVLQAPDNVVVVPATGDVFLQEDGPAEQFVRGVTPKGAIYDFAETVSSDSEFCGGCFAPDGKTFFLNQQGGRGNLPFGTPGDQATTYAIFGPFGDRD